MELLAVRVLELLGEGKMYNYRDDPAPRISLPASQRRHRWRRQVQWAGPHRAGPGRTWWRCRAADGWTHPWPAALPASGLCRQNESGWYSE